MGVTTGWDDPRSGILRQGCLRPAVTYIRVETTRLWQGYAKGHGRRIRHPGGNGIGARLGHGSQPGNTKIVPWAKVEPGLGSSQDLPIEPP